MLVQFAAPGPVQLRPDPTDFSGLLWRRAKPTWRRWPGSSSSRFRGGSPLLWSTPFHSHFGTRYVVLCVKSSLLYTHTHTSPEFIHFVDIYLPLLVVGQHCPRTSTPGADCPSGSVQYHRSSWILR